MKLATLTRTGGTIHHAACYQRDGKGQFLVSGFSRDAHADRLAEQSGKAALEAQAGAAVRLGALGCGP